MWGYSLKFRPEKNSAKDMAGIGSSKDISGDWTPPTGIPRGTAEGFRSEMITTGRFL